MNRREQADAFWALPIPRTSSHPGAPRLAPVVPIFFAAVPFIVGGLMLSFHLRSGASKALHDAIGYFVVTSLVCAPLSSWSLVKYLDWQRVVRTGSVETAKLVSLRRFEGKGFGYFLSMERSPGQAKLLRATVMGPKPSLGWIGESYAVGDELNVVTSKSGTVCVVLGNRLIDTRETARKQNE